MQSCLIAFYPQQIFFQNWSQSFQTLLLLYMFFWLQERSPLWMKQIPGPYWLNQNLRVGSQSWFFCSFVCIFLMLFIWPLWALLRQTSLPYFNCQSNSQDPFYFFFSFSIQVFSCSVGDLVSWPGIELRPLHWELGVLSQWTTKEVLLSHVIFFNFLTEEKLLYNTVLVSTIYWHDSAVGIHMSPPSWTSLPPVMRF